MLQFTHLLIEAKSKYSTNIRPYIKTHDILESVDGFSQISLNYNSFPPIKIKTKPMIFILERRPDVIVPELPKRVKIKPEPQIITEPEIEEEVSEQSEPEQSEPEIESVPEPEPDPELELEPEPEPEPEIEFSDEQLMDDEEEEETSEEQLLEPDEDVKSVNADIEDLGKEILDEEIMNEISQLDELETKNVADTVKIKETIKKILHDYKMQLLSEATTAEDREKILSAEEKIQMIRNGTRDKKMKKLKPTLNNFNKTESKFDDSNKDLEEALSLNKGSIKIDEDGLKPEIKGGKKKKKSKKNKKEGEDAKPSGTDTDNENESGSWLNFFR